MVSPAFEVLKPGLQSTLQDWPGRVGYLRVGIPPSGPMDAVSFRLANALVGNAPGATALEFQFIGPTLKALRNLDVAIVGGESALTVDGEPVPANKTLTLRGGQVLGCGGLRTGARAYLAVSGGFAKELFLGSTATFPRCGIGGNAIAAGQTLEAVVADARPRPMRLRPEAVPAFQNPAVIEVTAGPHFDWLDATGRSALLATPWTVSARSDRTGIRLSGPKIGFADRAINKAPENGAAPTNVINTGYPIGGVNLCGDTPIILPVDGPSQGGFITPLVVISAAMPKVGQLRPNQTLIFRRVSLSEAAAMRQALDRLIGPACLAQSPGAVRA
jgi:biotin-dependent carboxylase-like uncharacterized protein